MYIDPGNPRKSNRLKIPIPPKVKWQDFALPTRKTAKSNPQTQVQLGGGNGGGDGPSNLSWDTISWGDIKEAFEIIRPQLYPEIARESGITKAQSLPSEIVQDNCFGAISLKSYDDDKPPVVFGKIISSFPESSTIKTLHQAELYIPSKSKPLGKKKITTGDIESTGVVKTWYMNTALFGTSEDFMELGKAEGEFHKEGFHLKRSTDPQPIEQYISMPKENKDSQPWIYIISSNWLSRLDIHISNLVTANLRFLLEKGNRIILNYLSHPSFNLNDICDLKTGRDPTRFLEAKTPKEALGAIRDAFNELIKQPLGKIL